MADEGDSDILLEESLEQSTSSEDDLEILINQPRTKNENYLEEVVPQYSEEVFFEHFRVTRATAINISQRYEDSEHYNNQPGPYGNLSAFSQQISTFYFLYLLVLIYLWYIGHQTAGFKDVGDRFNVTISSINRIIIRLTYFLSNLSPLIIKWPTDEGKRISEEHFRANGFPNVIGAIDGTHIKIDKPENDPESYINRKGYYSIQMQAVCDHRKKILDVFIGYPGSVHDSRVYRNSPLKNTLEQKCGRYFILGDSGYPLENFLLTPYKNRGHLNRRQQNYNVKLAKNRYVIEHCFGLLKQKFRQLYHVKLRKIDTIVHFIRAACVLHNIALDNNFDGNYEDPGPNQELEPNQNGEEFEDSDDEAEEGARAVRDRVANTLRF